MKQLNPKEINTTALAYIGDAVYEVYVRRRVLAASGMPVGEKLGEAADGAASGELGAAPGASTQKQAYGAHVDALHKRAIKYVKASGQAKAVKHMLADGFLSQDEEALVRRARNHKTASKPKNADAMDYKYATAFEALIGYLNLTDDTARMEEIIFHAFEIIDDNPKGGK